MNEARGFSPSQWSASVLVTEVGNQSLGDAAQYVATVRRLNALGARVTLLCRIDPQQFLARAGLAPRLVRLPIQEPFDGIDNAGELVACFAARFPEQHQEMRAELERHNLVAVAPGGRYAEGYRNARNLLTAAVAQSLGIPVIVLPQSVGPLDNPAHRRLLVEVFSRCERVLVREHASYRFLLALGIPAERLFEARDVVLAEPFQEPAAASYHLGINVRTGANGHVRVEALREFVRAYAEARPQSRVLVYSTTYHLAPELTRALSGEPCELRPRLVSLGDEALIGRCAVNISDSYHGVLYSMLAGRPVIACQTDYRTWKLRGVSAPEQEPLELLPGFINSQEARRVLDRVLAVEREPRPTLDRQRRIVEYGRERAEAGWRLVRSVLAARATNRPGFDLANKPD